VPPKHKIIHGVRYIGMVFGIAGSQLFNNAKPLAAEMVGSAQKITPTSRHLDHIRRGFKGGIHIDLRNSSGSFATLAAIRRYSKSLLAREVLME
jgi:hypothetical protein